MSRLYPPVRKKGAGRKPKSYKTKRITIREDISKIIDKVPATSLINLEKLDEILFKWIVRSQNKKSVRFTHIHSLLKELKELGFPYTIQEKK